MVKVLQSCMRCIMLFFACYPCSEGIAQTLAAQGSPATALESNQSLPQAQVHQKSLEQYLQMMGEQYEVNFLYDQQFVAGKMLENGQKVTASGLENHLLELLLPFDLSYRKIDDTHYIIRQKVVVDSEDKTKAQPKPTQSQEPTANRTVPVKVSSLKVVQMEQSISGQVIDENDTPLPGVNIVVKGTTIGTVTNVDGNYRLVAPDDAEALIFSSVGYIQEEVSINNRSQINMKMQPDIQSLSEVVVVGYGTQQRSEISGSVASISGDQIQEVPALSFDNAIQGRIAGVEVSVPSGEPGAAPQIRIRGTSSISAGNDPLFVIDGLPISKNSNLQVSVDTRRSAFSVPKQNAFATLNPNDIESIEVLKDASAAAIYGSRASNGVVLVTTKKGKAGKSKISFNAYTGMKQVINKPDLMNSEELISYAQDSRNNNYLQSYDPLNPASEYYNPDYNPATNAGRPDIDFVLMPEKYVNWDGTDTDWLDLVLSTGTIQNYNLSVGGGKDDFTYYTSGSYYKEKGIIEGSEFDRFTLNTSLTNHFTENISAGVNMNMAFTDNDRLPVNAPYFAQPPGIIYTALVHSPVIKPYEADGVTPNQTDNQSFLLGGTTTADNPLAVIEAVNENIRNYRAFGNAYLSYKFLDNFTFKTYLGIDLDYYMQSFYRGNTLLYRGSASGDPYGQSSAALGINWLWENTLNYNNQFGKHSVDAIVGYTSQKQSNTLNMVAARNYPDDQVQTISGGIVTGGTSLEEEWSLVSALARVNYSYDEKYLFTGTVRSDRSSRFGLDNQTGVFPSASVGWRIANEQFMSNIRNTLNELKIRASYGVTGNFEISNYGSIGLLTSGNYVLGGQIVNGVVPSTLSNRDLSWETTTTFDLGLDFALFKDRIYGSLDYYVNNTTDLLLMVTIPSSSGFQTTLRNIGEVENRGFEFSFTSRNLVKDFKWETDFNFSMNENEVLALGPDSDEIPAAGAAGTRHITRVGSPIGSYYGYVVEGIYQSEDEIEDALEDQLAPDSAPGDLRFSDVDGDGVINANDRTPIGSYFPDFIYGMTNRFRYRNLDMSIFVQGVEGREVLNLTQRHLLNGEANFNSYADYNNRWISAEQPGDGTIPRADRNSGAHGNNFRPSSFQVEDASFFRIRNVTLGYNVPLRNTTDYRLRIYATGTDLFIWTPYRGFNPEVNLQAGSSITPGEDYGAYPLSSTYILGVNFSF